MTIVDMITTFKKDVEQLVKGRPEAGEEGLIQNLRRSKEQFREAIFRQAPEFKPFRKPKESGDTSPTEDASTQSTENIGEVLDLDLEPQGPKNPDTFVYMDEVASRAQKSVFTCGHYCDSHLTQCCHARVTKSSPLRGQRVLYLQVHKEVGHACKEIVRDDEPAIP